MTAIAFIVKYWRQIGIALLLVGSVLLVRYVQSVFNDRDKLKTENSALQQQVKDAEVNAKLNNRIAEAIGQIRVRSQINVSRIESEAKPVFEDDDADPRTPTPPLMFIPGGLLQALYSSASPAAGAAPGITPGAAVQPAGQPGGVLPR